MPAVFLFFLLLSFVKKATQILPIHTRTVIIFFRWEWNTSPAMWIIYCNWCDDHFWQGSKLLYDMLWQSAASVKDHHLFSSYQVVLITAGRSFQLATWYFCHQMLPLNFNKWCVMCAPLLYEYVRNDAQWKQTTGIVHPKAADNTNLTVTGLGSTCITHAYYSITNISY